MEETAAVVVPPNPPPNTNNHNENSTVTSAANEVESLFLKWNENEHYTCVKNTFKQLKEESDFVDVTLACGLKSFKAHKVVLSACSPYFRQLLKDNPCQHPIIILHEARWQNIEALVKFMYDGEVNVSQDHLPDFLKMAQSLRIVGLNIDDLGGSSSNKSINWPSHLEVNTKHHSMTSEHHSHSKKSRFSSGHRHSSRSTSPAYRGHRNSTAVSGSSGTNKNSSSLDLSQTHNNSQMHHNHPNHQLHSSNDGSDYDDDDEPSDVEEDNGPSTNVTELVTPKLESGDLNSMRQDQHLNNLLNGRFAYGAMGVLDLASILPTAMANMPNNNSHQDSYVPLRRNSETTKVRATDPRPCPKCNKIYRSAHTLRTHLEDKHTVCSGYRCVLCGTVAKSRNSLHSHMSRQHRGISTKDLPVVPMPAPFDPELASQLYRKAGIQMSAAELQARASPTGNMTPTSMPMPVTSPQQNMFEQRMETMESDNNSETSGVSDDPQDLSVHSSNNNNINKILPNSGMSPEDIAKYAPLFNNMFYQMAMNKENVDSS